MRGLKRSLQVLWVLALVAIIVLPALPRTVGGQLSVTMGHWLRKISVRQRWAMYAPNPHRRHGYMRLVAHFPDGRTEVLQESRLAEEGWETMWAWDKDRLAIWQFYATMRPERRNRNRRWYLRSVCVREARRQEVPPQKIAMTLVTRRFRSPAAVRAGKSDLTKPRERPVAVQRCDFRPVRKMIEEDRERRRQRS